MSNVVDMARYVSMLINRGEFNGVKILGKEWIERLREATLMFLGR